MITADVNSDGCGSATLAFEPPIRSAPADNAPLIEDFPPILSNRRRSIRLWDADVGNRHLEGASVMQYILLIYHNEEQVAAMSEKDMAAMYKGYGTFTKGIVKSGHFKAGDPLQPVATATTVRVRNGKTLLTDGPFAETNEQLAGYYVVEAANLDEATAMAAKIPTAKHGSIEVRPIMPMGEM